jgi:hypothetical protein
MKCKRGSARKLISIFSAIVILIMAIGVYAETELSSQEVAQISEKVDRIVTPALSDAVQGYVTAFAEKKGVKAENINNISEVDFDSLPKEVNIENIGDTNLAIYQVNYNESSSQEQKNLFVITYSTEKLAKQGDIIVAQDKRQFLNFGSEEEMNKGFLKTAAGVEGSLETGYVMMRSGSITGISTSLDVINTNSDAKIEIIVYKNGEPISFSNSIDASSSGVKKDYDIQSKEVVEFQPGDVISAYTKVVDGDASYKSIITMVEITTTN